ncbi:sigma factor binding protein 1, chloroplastic-like [Diospyros lotus]|uniref:sigma factor binding protein 1, chloroplastic-like n=1 Tax=Diospyros lotus TaxID=55363 RepID=UPI0022588202|nr:sigma factor binding protein 1, chloroplastic-like [Diospyros lotus]
MDKSLSVHGKKAPKHPKTKKKPVKVVYISNPMMVKTTASEFRALVQELTGQEAGGTPDFCKYRQIGSGCGGRRRLAMSTDKDAVQVPTVELEPHAVEVPERSDLTVEDQHDDVFVPQMLEDFGGFFPSNMFEFPHVAGLLES